MLINRPPDIPSYEITDESLFWNRRAFLKAAGLGAAAIGGVLPFRGSRLFTSDEDKLTPWEDVTGYNNYYEFGTGKDDPARNATRFRTRPWKVEVAGEVKRPAVYDFDDLLKPFSPAERVYRMRCVEGWSMVVPWLGIPLGALIDRLEPTSNAGSWTGPMSRGCAWTRPDIRSRFWSPGCTASRFPIRTVRPCG
jgi:methionine sulfoxide reductase catalytic subunit